MAGFFDEQTLKSLEGKYVTFVDGIVREFRLISHRSEEREAQDGRKYTVYMLGVIDQQTGDEKEVNADFRLMNKLKAINHLLDEGTVLYIKPSHIGTTPSGRDKFDYDVSLEPFDMTSDDM